MTAATSSGRPIRPIGTPRRNGGDLLVLGNIGNELGARHGGEDLARRDCVHAHAFAVCWMAIWRVRLTTPPFDAS